jgi:Domain of unknown function (DUF4177)
MKWEYKTIKLPTGSFFEKKPSFGSYEVDKFINELGQEGWELVSTSRIVSLLSFGAQPITTAVILFFKRPLAE